MNASPGIAAYRAIKALIDLDDGGPLAALPAELRRRRLRRESRVAIRQRVKAWQAADSRFAAHAIVHAFADSGVNYRRAPDLLRALNPARGSALAAVQIIHCLSREDGLPGRRADELREAYAALRGMRLADRAKSRRNPHWAEDERDDMRADVRGEYEEAL